MTEDRHESRPQPAGRSDLLIEQPGQLRLELREYDHADAIALVRALFDDQIGRYGFADPAEANPEAYRRPVGAFLVGYVEGVAVTCGGYRAAATGLLRRSARANAHQGGGSVVEVKKMYTSPEHRGRGYGRSVLAALESLAREDRATAIILETGVRNLDALGLYRSVGYEPTRSYVPGRDPSINRAFIKALDVATKSPGHRSPLLGPGRE